MEHVIMKSLNKCDKQAPGALMTFTSAILVSSPCNTLQNFWVYKLLLELGIRSFLRLKAFDLLKLLLFVPLSVP